jgi:hypothetical protein
MWKRSSTTIQARLADDSGYASAAVQDLTINGTCTGCGGYWTLTGSDIYYPSGKVGIWGGAPREALDVNGAVLVGGTTTVDGTKVAGLYARYGSGRADIHAHDSGTNTVVMNIGTISNDGTVEAAYTFYSQSGVITSASTAIYTISSPSIFLTGDVTGSGLYRFGGSTSSYPMWKRSSTTIQARLADDSGYASAAVQDLTINGTCTGCPVSSVTGSGSGISVSPTTGAVVVSNTGVTSLAGSSPISASASTSSVTIACPTCVSVDSPVALTGQTGNISGNLTWGGGTPPAGLYRVSAYQVTTTFGSSGTETLTISWTDNSAAQSVVNTIPLTSPAAGFEGYFTTVVRSNGSAISYSTSVAGASGSPQYALYITLEKLI